MLYANGVDVILQMLINFQKGQHQSGVRFVIAVVFNRIQKQFFGFITQSENNLVNGCIQQYKFFKSAAQGRLCGVDI